MEANKEDEELAKYAGILRAHSPALRYCVALLFCGLAAAIDYAFPIFSIHVPLLSFLFATCAAAWFGGFRAGLLASALSILIVRWFFVPPHLFGGVDHSTTVRLALVGLVLASISWLIDHRAFALRLIQAQKGEAADMLRRHQAMLSSAAQIAGMGSWEYDIVNDRLEWDDETLRIFGVTRSTFAGNAAAFFSLVHPDDREALQASRSRVVANHGVTEMEYQIVRPDGVVRRIHDRGQMTRHHDGQPVQSTGMVMDVTERKETEDAVRASEERWRAIFDNSAVGIALADEKGHFTLTNSAYQKMLGYTDEELRTMTYVELTHEDDRNAAAELGAELWQGKMLHFQHENRYRCKDGKVIWGRNAVSLLPGTKATPRSSMAIVEDITEKLSMEEQIRQSQRMEAVGRLAGGVAHDFNNMLGVIMGHCVNLLETLRVGVPEWHKVDQIKKACTRSADLTHQLLAFSRKDILAPKVLDLNAILADLSSMLASMAGDDIELVIRPGKKLNYIKADQGQIGRVVMNLVVNARDAMPQGGQVVIATENVAMSGLPEANGIAIPAGSYVMLAVSDSGCGMEVETLRHIFEPFFTTKETGKGTGLGLAMVYGTVQQSDGFIVPESQPGTGTTFRIYLPQAEGRPETAGVEHERYSADRGEETVLLAEDEPLLREVVRFQLEDAGYTVLEAHNGNDALLQARRYNGRIDLLLTDVVMDGRMNGIELATLLEPTRPELKVLYMTGYTADTIDAKRLADFQDKVLQKPFTADALRNRIREALTAKESERPPSEARSTKP